MTGMASLVGALALIALGGVFAAVDAAISTVSIARIDEMVREERPGAARLARLTDDRPRYVNLIVLCPEFAAKQAEKAGHSLGQEIALLTVHGVLHLLGYDHAEPDEEKEMFALQRELLEEWVADQVAAYHQDRQNEKDRRLLDKSQFFDQP